MGGIRLPDTLCDKTKDLFYSHRQLDLCSLLIYKVVSAGIDLDWLGLVLSNLQMGMHFSVPSANNPTRMQSGSLKAIPVRLSGFFCKR